MTQTTRSRLTLEEFLTYDRNKDTRYELVDGVLVEMGTESTINLIIAGFLFAAFLQSGIPPYRIGFKQWIVVSSAAVTARDPDLIIHSEASFAAIEQSSQALILSDAPPPLLVIEIVSPGEPGEANYERDYVEKRREYAARGIPEYWIIDPTRQMTIVLSLEREAYQEIGQFRENAPILSPTFPIIQLTTQQILNAGR